MPRKSFEAAPLQNDDDSDDEELRRVLEMSIMEAERCAGSSSQTEDEDEDLKRAMELSLLSDPMVKMTVMMTGKHEEEDIDCDTELQEALKLSLLDMENKKKVEKATIRDYFGASVDEKTFFASCVSGEETGQEESNEVVNNDELNNVKWDNDDSIVVLNNDDVSNADTIDSVDDEFDSICAANSSTQSLRDRLTNPKASTSIIIIESDNTPPVKVVKKNKKKMAKKTTKPSTAVPMKVDKKPVLTCRGASAGPSRVATAGPCRGAIYGPDGGETSSSSRQLSCRFGSDSEEELEKDAEAAEDDCPTINKVESVPIQPALSTEEVIMRMRNVFESGLAIHFSGEEMEACKAVSTPLFPHQRVALAWMFKHENKEADGMWGGILADDMGLGKTLTVIALILTNHWDSKPLAKPELGFTRPPFSLGQRGARKKGKVGGAFRPKVSAEAFGVGSKIGGGVAKKTTIGGLFDKFNERDSEKENKNAFKFDKQSKMRTKVLKKQFIDESSSCSGYDEDSDWSEDEFDKMSSKDNVFKASVKDLFKKDENPLEFEEEDDNLSMMSMIPTAFDGACDIDLDSKLNVDGFLDESSGDEDRKADKKMSTSKEMKKRKLDTEEIKQKQLPEKKFKLSKPLQSDDDDDDDDSDISLPEVSVGASTPSVKGETSKLMKDESPEAVEPEKTQVSEETGLKLIKPPKDPAVRAGRRRATLLVCPTSLISHWVEQLQQHLHRSVNIKLKVHHGANKSLTGADLESHDIVITTYGTLAAELGVKDVTPLTRAKWLRVVMDEGHCIKNHNSKSAKAALGLDTIRRWIVTGTPIQNNLMELWSLVNWLNFGMYCGKSQMKVFKQQIEGPCKKGIPRGFERLQVLMDTICIRRTKTDRKPDGSPLVVLPSKTIVTREVVMIEEERLCYAIYHKRAQEIVGRYHKKGQLLRNYAHVFALMMRLRQLCCHRELIKEVDWVEALRDKVELASQLEGFLDEDEITNSNQTTDGADSGLESDLEKKLVMQLREMIRSGVSDDCSVCLDDLKTPVITPCAHVFCKTCIEQVLETIKPPTCPLCRNKIDNKKQLLEAGQDDEGEEKGEGTLFDMEDIQVNVSSSKVNAVLKEMLRIQRDFPEDKIIVVSQFTSFLSILQPLIKQNNFSLVRLDGSMSHFERSETVNVFQSSKKNSPKVLLLSLKAGGVGLNLTAANHLLLLDPAWNPASEWQCFDRTHRLGQKKEVTIYKYITKDSIEEKMLEIQAKKKDLISGAFHMPVEERRRQRVDDIRNIFDI